MDQEFRDAFTSLGSQVEGVEQRLNDRIDKVHGEFLNFKTSVIGATDPPPVPPAAPVAPSSGQHDIASIIGVDEAALAVLNGTKQPTATIRARVKTTEDQIARILTLQEAQSKEQGTGTRFLSYLASRSGRKLVLQVITAILVLAGYVDTRLNRAPSHPDPAPLPAPAVSR